MSTPYPPHPSGGQEPTRPQAPTDPYAAGGHQGAQSPYAGGPVPQWDGAPRDPYGPQDHPPAGYQLPGQQPQVREHPQGTVVLVLGILSIFLPVLGPVAWVLGRSALKEVDASPVPAVNRSQLSTGKALGIIGTLLLIMSVLWVVGVTVAFFTAPL